ncbi:Fic/DOC family protein [Lactobacillus acetotolerans]|jgi:cell filamentation protein|uniref:Fic/DOC family protein n=1 Tax=Lactobacillus acetotolerans TaxID=1600 RepID=UPI000E9BD724|nr:Fic family protein [Lactobacillus acetotolerans]MBN7276779.1 hypothetical protein [Lactobacillus acetotolerans]HBG91036.1 hypothetical protein [Lactobacillus acetotolerans]HCX40013.1 hypothetical protein [Lactobacillus acetotolerans]
MSYYKTFDDTLLPNGTLKNKLGITNEKDLAKREYVEVALHEVEFLKKKKKITSINDLYRINKILFSTVYSWAGKERNYPLRKGNHDFMDFRSFDQAEIYINKLLKSDNQKDELSSLDYAKLLDSINDMHPFREGNGRSTRTFLQCLAANHEQVVDYPRHNDQLIKAQNSANVKKEAQLISLQNTPTRETAFKELLAMRKGKIKRDKFN